MDLVDRLFERLRRAIADEPGGGSVSALTVADVYQRLIPYRAIRVELGILELAEYEHALLRLLSGDRGYMAVEAEAARAELKQELASPNPILGVYRDYSAFPVRFLGEHANGQPAASDPMAEAAPSEPPLPTLGPFPGYRTGTTPGEGEIQDGTQDGALSEPPPERTARCSYCTAELPDEHDLRFCPSCGGDQRDVRCAQCEAPLRDEWRFCIRCGNPRPGVDHRR